jgi:hypothetical protein
MNMPATLYRYEKVNLQTLRNLKNQVIYLGAPRNFNDPYDCAIGAPLKDLSDEGLERLLQGQRVNASNETLKEMFKEGAAKTIQELADQFLNERGVACFTEAPDNLLMWSHYADGARGMCLGFSSSANLFEKARKVTYSDLIPSLDLEAILCDKHYDPLIELYRTKSSHWSYEQEWRVIHEKAGTCWNYDSSSLESVYFGPNVPDDLLQIALLILMGQNATVQFFRAKRSEHEFRMLFEQFYYTRIIEARALGLLPEA